MRRRPCRSWGWQESSRRQGSRQTPQSSRSVPVVSPHSRGTKRCYPARLSYPALALEWARLQSRAAPAPTAHLSAALASETHRRNRTGIHWRDPATVSKTAAYLRPLGLSLIRVLSCNRIYQHQNLKCLFYSTSISNCSALIYKRILVLNYFKWAS